MNRKEIKAAHDSIRARAAMLDSMIATKRSITKALLDEVVKMQLAKIEVPTEKAVLLHLMTLQLKALHLVRRDLVVEARTLALLTEQRITPITDLIVPDNLPEEL